MRTYLFYLRANSINKQSLTSQHFTTTQRRSFARDGSALVHDVELCMDVARGAVTASMDGRRRTEVCQQKASSPADADGRVSQSRDN